MRVFLGIVVCILLETSLAVSDAWQHKQRLHHVSMAVPSMKERLAGAKPRGGINHSRNAPSTPRPRHREPSVPQPDIAGEAAVRSNKNASVFIHNGSEAKLGQFPWMLAIEIDHEFFCGGSLIAEQWVLTAGHCVDGATRLTITAGSLMYSDGTESTMQTLTSRSYWRHPDYNAMFVDNDIGIIKPAGKFVWNENVKPVRLPSYSMGEDMMTGKIATLSGWGLIGDGEDEGQSKTLLFTTFTVNDGTACYNYYGNTWIPTKVCIDTSKDKKSSCEGDSGGPLVIQEEDGKWTEIGLTSFGSILGCSVGLPIAFTRVASFLEFVETTTNIRARD